MAKRAAEVASGTARASGSAVFATLVVLLILTPRPASAGGALEAVTQGAAASVAPLAPVTSTPGANVLGPTPGASVVVAAPLASDDPAPRGEELALRVAALIAGRLGTGARAEAQTAQLATARALAGRAGALVYVQTAIAKGDLRATVDVYPSIGNAWDRIRNPMPSPASHGFATAKIDAEVRTYLTPLLLEQASVERARHDEGDVLAAACGDVDGDGGNELVLVSPARVALGRIRGGRFVPERTAGWDGLGPASAVPMRDPLGAAAVAPGAIAVGSTDRGGVRLHADLSMDAPLLGLPVWGGDGVVCLMPEASAGAFDGAPVECSLRREPRPAMAVPAPRFDAFSAMVVADATGVAHTIVVVREPSGRLRLKSGDALGVPDGAFGAQLAVGDLDQDGVPDVATSMDLPVAGAAAGKPDDAIDIATWTPGEPELRGRVHLAAPGGVRALAMCPPEEHGEPTLIAVVGGEVWLVRAARQGAVQVTADPRKAVTPAAPVSPGPADAPKAGP